MTINLKCGNEPTNEERKNHRIIVTHDGKFHTDEVAAIALLLIGPLHSQTNVFVARTRLPYWQQNADFVLDVGERYDPTHNFFDHHHVDFNITYPDDTLYATAGLVWLKYGEEIILHLLKEQFIDTRVASDVVVDIYDRVATILKRIDNIDNGQSTRGYTNSPLVGMIGPLNPRKSAGMSWDTYHENCKTAINTAYIWLKNKITTIVAATVAKPGFVECVRAFRGQEYIVFPATVPWRDMVNEYWDELAPFKLVISTDDDQSDRWVIHGLPVRPKRTDQLRCSAPYWMRGKKGAELEAVVGISDLIYCHRNGFMCYTSSLASAEAVARYMIDIQTQCDQNVIRDTHNVVHKERRIWIRN